MSTVKTRAVQYSIAHRLSCLCFSTRARRRVAQLLEEGAVLGFDRNVPEVREAEDALSTYHGGRHVMALGSGHASLQMSLAGLDISAGDEVITTPYSFGVSTSCILHQNAIPVFADVNRNTGLIEAKAIEERITRRTRGILIVHNFGHPCDMTAIMRVANRHHLSVIEDGNPSHYMWTMNFRSKAAGVHRDTFQQAVRAEGLPMVHYGPAVIPAWPRLQWQTYQGPRAPWLDNLRRAKVVYRKEDDPNACHKADHSLELLFRFYKPVPKTMHRIADIVYKVEANIDALRAYEQQNST